MTTRRMPSLNWLRVFEAAARLESFARAAEVLNMSPPAVSQQIQALEGHLGRKLFLREAKRVRLTDSGRAFLPTIQQALASIETTAAALFAPEGRQQIMVQAIGLLAMGWLPRQIARFEARHPDIRVTVVTAEDVYEFRSVRPGIDPDLQIAFGSSSDFPEGATRLLGEDLSVVARPDIATETISEEGIVAHRLLEPSYHRSGWHQVLAARTGLDLRDADITLVDGTPLALMMAAEGLGLALARAPASDGMVRALGLQTLQWIEPVRGMQSYFLMTPDSRPVRKETARLRDWILAAADEEINNKSDGSGLSG